MNTMKFKIEEELIKIGFNPLHKGTIYLIEKINIIYNSNNQKSMYKINLEKDVYSKL